MAATQRAGTAGRFNPSVVLAVIAAVLLIISLFVADQLGVVTTLPGLGIGVVVFYIAALLTNRLLRSSYAPRPEGSVLGATRLRFSAEGIQQERTNSSSTSNWSHYEGTSRTATHVFVWVDRISGYIVPVRDLPEDLSAEQFCTAVDSLAAEGKGAQLNAVAPALAMRPPSTAAHRSSASMLVTTLVAAVLAWTAFDYAMTGAGATLNSFEFAGVAWYVLGALAMAWLVTVSVRPPPLYAAVAIRVVLAGLVAVCALAMVSRLEVASLWRWSAYAAVIAGSLFILWYLKRETGRWQFGASFIGGCAAMVFWWASASTYVSANLWYVQDDESAEVRTEEQLPETLLFDQAEKVDAAIAALTIDTSAPSAFFIGFAGYGEQRVFAEEIALADRVIGQRYGTSSRSVRLVNDQRDLTQRPLATVNGLARALTGLSRRMDTGRDVLILALSSHGSEDELSVRNDGLPLLQLSGERLATMLRDAGIRRKVIIISACYAGSFIESLKDKDTIVITAAAADRTSFGCSDDRDLTYFGEAFYRDALPEATSLRQAFETARAAIGEREKEEGVTPSLPQASFGADLEAYLADWP